MISIITSLYKTDRYLDKFSQHLKNFANELKSKNVPFEIIAIANDPTQRERQLEKELSSETWFSFVAVGRESVFASFNRGFALAKADILGWWNADDIRYSAAVVEAVNLFAKGAELVHFPFLVKRYFKFGPMNIPIPAQKVDKQIPQFSQNTKRQFLESMVCGPFFLFTRVLYERVGPFDEQFKIAGDLDWCIRAANKTDKFVKAKTIGGIFRVDGGGLSAGTNPRRTAENNVVYVRNHSWDKIAVAEDLIIKDYRTKHLLCAGNFIALSQFQKPPS